MENRYTNNLKKGNQQILSLTPANQTLRLVAAIELKKIYSTGERVLEIGCGEGDSAKYVLENSNVSLDLLDVSSEMIESCRVNLSQFSTRANYICQDALEYLTTKSAYNIIFSEWTIHNFTWENKIKLLEAIYSSLAPDGHFILMDKVYPNWGAKTLLKKQIGRYKLLEPEVSRDIINHEFVDFSKEYKMTVKILIRHLKRVGFKDIKIVDRVERDVVLIAKKPNFIGVK